MLLGATSTPQLPASSPLRRPATAAATTHSRVHQALRENDNSFEFSIKEATLDGLLYSSRFPIKDIANRRSSSAFLRKDKRNEIKKKSDDPSDENAKEPTPETDIQAKKREIRRQLLAERQRARSAAPTLMSGSSSDSTIKTVAVLDETAFILRKRRCAKTFEDMIAARLKPLDSAGDSKYSAKTAVDTMPSEHEANIQSPRIDNGVDKLLEHGIIQSVLALSTSSDAATQGHCCRALYYLSRFRAARKPMIAQSVVASLKQLSRTPLPASRQDIAATLCHLSEEGNVVEALFFEGIDRSLLRLITSPSWETKRICAATVFNLSADARHIRHFREVFSQLLIAVTKANGGVGGSSLFNTAEPNSSSTFLIKAIYNASLVPIFHCALIGENTPRFLATHIPLVPPVIQGWALRSFISLCEVQTNRQLLVSSQFCELLESMLLSANEEIQEITLLILLQLSSDEGSRIKICNWLPISSLVNTTTQHIKSTKSAPTGKQTTTTANARAKHWRTVWYPVTIQSGVTLLAHLAHHPRNRAALVRNGAVFRFLKKLNRLKSKTESKTTTDEDDTSGGENEEEEMEQDSDDGTILTNCAFVYYCLTATQEGCEFLVKERGVEDLINLSRIRTKNTGAKAEIGGGGVAYTMKELCTLALCRLSSFAGLESRLIEQGAIQTVMVLALVATDSITIKALCIMTLANCLVDVTPHCLQSLIGHGIIWALSSLCTVEYPEVSYSSEELRQLAAMVLLRVTSANDAVISPERVKLTMLLWMEQIIDMKDEDLVRNCMLTVHDLTSNSSLDVAELDVPHILRILVQVLQRHHTHNAHIVTLCLSALYNLSCQLAALPMIMQSEILPFLRQQVPLTETTLAAQRRKSASSAHPPPLSTIVSSNLSANVQLCCLLSNAPGNQSYLLNAHIANAMVYILDLPNMDSDASSNILAALCHLSSCKTHLPRLLNDGALPCVVKLTDYPNATAEMVSYCFELLSNLCSIDFQGYLKDCPEINVIGTLAKLSDHHKQSHHRQHIVQHARQEPTTSLASYCARGEGNSLPLPALITNLMKSATFTTGSAKKTLQLKANYTVLARKWSPQAQPKPKDPPPLVCKEIPPTDNGQVVAPDVKQRIGCFSPLPKEPLIRDEMNDAMATSPVSAPNRSMLARRNSIRSFGVGGLRSRSRNTSVVGAGKVLQRAQEARHLPK
ncbi:Armadillo-type fold [Phytophthora cactorum]|nr:Armadillo-type fold [Phytophthora cactorum]